MTAAQSSPAGTPFALQDGWRVDTGARQGIDAAQLGRLIEAAARPLCLHGALVARRGSLVAEYYFTAPDKSHGAWWPRRTAFGPEVLHDVRSIGKSVVGLLFGIAQAQGHIGPVSTPLHVLLPQYGELRTPERSVVTLEHLLTMSAGLQWKEIGSSPSWRDTERHLHRARDAVRKVVARPVISVPGSRFNYHSGATLVLAALIEQATGKPLESYAREMLFAPLGIDHLVWKADWRGRAMPGLGLRMRPRDLLKIGQLLLNNGVWEGRSVVPSAWVAALQQPLVSTGDGMQYSYQWWVSAMVGPNTPPPWLAAFGKGGQRLFVVPSLELTVVLTSGAYERAGSSRAANELFRRLVALVA